MSWLVKTLLGAATGPVFSGLLDGYKAKLAAGTDHDKLAADLAGRELLVQQAEIQAQAQLRTAEIGHAWEPDKLLAYLVVLYFAKVIAWDTVLGLGVTPALHGAAGTLIDLVTSFYFLKRGIENVARIWKR